MKKISNPKWVSYKMEFDEIHEIDFGLISVRIRRCLGNNGIHVKASWPGNGCELLQPYSGKGSKKWRTVKAAKIGAVSYLFQTSSMIAKILEEFEG